MKINSLYIVIALLFFIFLTVTGCKKIDSNESLEKQLRIALEKNNKPFFKKLLKEGANPNTIYPDGYWILGEVAKKRNLDYLKLAIEFGGDVDLKNPYLGSQTPIYIAESVNNINAINYLLDKGADANIRDCPECEGGEGISVLSEAIYSGSFETAYLIFQHKGNLKKDEMQLLITAIEEDWIIKTSKDNAYRSKFIEYLQLQGYKINMDKKPECYKDPTCKEEKKYKRKIERCNIVKSNPPENVPAEGIEEFLDKCEKNMPMYIEKAGQ